MKPVQPASLPPDSGTLLYVSSRLGARKVSGTGSARGSFTDGGEEFRLLTPEWYAWLHRRMEKARAARLAGRLPAGTWEGLRRRFNGLHAWAAAQYGVKALRDAVAGFSAPEKATALPERETAPEGDSGASRRHRHLHPEAGEYRFTVPVTAGALAKVDAIRERALALGWTHAQLYQNRGQFKFPCGPEWGLAGFLTPASRIGRVTRQYIEIETPGWKAGSNRFHNMETEQPWLKRVTTQP